MQTKKKNFEILIALGACACFSGLYLVVGFKKRALAKRYKSMSDVEKFEYLMKDKDMKNSIEEFRRDFVENFVKPYISEMRSAGADDKHIETLYNKLVYCYASEFVALASETFSKMGWSDKSVSYCALRLTGMMYPDIREYLETNS